MRTKITTLALAAALVTLGCALGLARAEVPTGPPAFTNPTDIDNTYFPVVPLRLKVHELGDGDEVVIEVHRTGTRTFTLAGGTNVDCRILEEWEYEDGELIEISINYFAQADDGTVYYFGEVVDIYEDGSVVSNEGSWLVGGPSGGDPAETATASQPAVFMPADPEVGDVWKPEDLPDADIEEFVKAKQFVKAVEVDAGVYEDVLRVREKTPAVEFKWYAPGVGFLKGKERSDILQMTELEDYGSAAAQQNALDDLIDEITG
jgi:hypothetical protein